MSLFIFYSGLLDRQARTAARSMQKIILVGQAPGKRSKEPLDGAAGRRLAALAGLDLPQFLKRFDRVNLLDVPGSNIVAMRKRVNELRESWKGRRVVLLNKVVALAFRLIDGEDFEWFKPLEVPPGIEVAVMPQPDGYE